MLMTGRIIHILFVLYVWNVQGLSNLVANYFAVKQAGSGFEFKPMCGIFSFVLISMLPDTFWLIQRRMIQKQKGTWLSWHNLIFNW